MNHSIQAMNQDLSIVTLLLHASFVVQLVVLLLVVISIASWAAIIRKYFALKRMRSLNDEFEREFQKALNIAATSYDTVPIEGVLDQWWRIAVQRSISLTEDEQDQVRRARAGDFTGLWEQASDGSFRRIE